MSRIWRSRCVYDKRFDVAGYRLVLMASILESSFYLYLYLYLPIPLLSSISIPI